MADGEGSGEVELIPAPISSQGKKPSARWLWPWPDGGSRRPSLLNYTLGADQRTSVSPVILAQRGSVSSLKDAAMTDKDRFDRLTGTEQNVQFTERTQHAMET